MTSHIRFLETNKTVCQSPNSLGYDMVVIDHSKGKSCEACLTLILIHNQRSRQYDLLVTLPENTVFTDEKPLMGTRALVHGVLLGSAMWIGIIAILWAVFYA